MLGLIFRGIIPILVIGVIIYLIFRWKSRRATLGNRTWYSGVASSRNEAFSQLFIFLSIAFLLISFLLVNQRFENPVRTDTIVLIMGLISLISAYYFRSIFSLIPGLLGTIGWWGYRLVDWMSVLTSGTRHSIRGSLLLLWSVLIALVFYVLGYLHKKPVRGRRFSLLYIILGISFITIILFLFSTRWGMAMLGELSRGASLLSSWQFLVSMVLAVLLFLCTLIFSLLRKVVNISEVIILVAIALLFVWFAVIPSDGLFSIADQRNYYLVIFNVVVFLETLGLIFSGYRRREIWRMNLGTFLLFALIAIKYTDWFYTFLDKSAFFIGAGVLLLLVGWFMERGRRQMISSVRAAVISSAPINTSQ